MGIFSDFYDGRVVSPLASSLESRVSSLATLGSLYYLAKKSEKIPRPLLNIIIYYS
jgi:hypothetical protein